jgi:hypothetical protein
MEQSDFDLAAGATARSVMVSTVCGLAPFAVASLKGKTDRREDRQ